MGKQANAPASESQDKILAAEAANLNEAGRSQQLAPSAGGGANASSGAAAAGGTVYQQNCSSCHAANGQGMPGTFPPLTGNAVVTGDPKKVISIVGNGLNGPIDVGGTKYNGQMPAWKATLSDKDIANVITFIRTGLGPNHAGAVNEAQVKAVLKK